MFIPLGTDRSTGRRATIVPILVVLNLAIYFGGLALSRSGDLDLQHWYNQGSLSLAGMRWWQPFSYQFLHDRDSIFHVLSNMVFLWAFGAVVEWRLGHLGFLALYLVGGALAGLLQTTITGGSVIGASGSVSVVAGAFLALYPRGTVVGYWIIPPTPGRLPALWLLGLYAAIDLVNTCTDFCGVTRTGIGTIAHLTGLLFGLVVCVALLGLKVLPRDDFDLFFLIRQWKRRRELRAVAIAAGVGTADGPVAGRVRAGAQSQETPTQMRLRATLAAAHRERDYVLAADLYQELVATKPDAVLPAEIQLDVANQLARSGKDRAAAAAYTLFLERFRTHPAGDDARLMLAVVLIRRLGEAGRGAELLREFDGRSLGAERDALVSALRAEAAPGGGPR
ncbi:MAG: rhomboid family intramembrane serine protease [Planctomycetota bacterium]